MKDEAKYEIERATLEVASSVYKWDLAIAFGFGLLAGVMGMGIWGVL